MGKNNFSKMAKKGIGAMTADVKALTGSRHVSFYRIQWMDGHPQLVVFGPQPRNFPTIIGPPSLFQAKRWLPLTEENSPDQGGLRKAPRLFIPCRGNNGLVGGILFARPFPSLTGFASLPFRTYMRAVTNFMEVVFISSLEKAFGELSVRLAKQWDQQEVIRTIAEGVLAPVGASGAIAGIEGSGPDIKSGDCLHWSLTTETLQKIGLTGKRGRNYPTFSFHEINLPGGEKKLAVAKVFPVHHKSKFFMVLFWDYGDYRGLIHPFNKSIFNRVKSQVSASLDRVAERTFLRETLDENRHHASDISFLYQMQRLFKEAITLDHLMATVLVGVCTWQGEKVDQAAIFMSFPGSKEFQGIMGVDGGQLRLPSWDRMLTKGVKRLATRLAPKIENLVKEHPFQKAVKSIRLPVEEGVGVVGRCLLRKDAVRCPLPGRRGKADKILYNLFKERALTVFPILCAGGLRGILVVGSTGPLPDREVGVLSTLSRQVTGALEQALLTEQLESRGKRLLDLESRLLQSERLRAMGEFISEITHQLKTPTAAIGGFSRRLASSLPAQSQEKKIADIMAQEALKLEGILREYLAFAKRETLSLEQVSLRNFIEDLVDGFRLRIETQGVELLLRIDEKLPQVTTSASLLGQAVGNLIDNALDTMKDGGRLGVRLKSHPTKPNWIRLEISDTGGGIPYQNLGNIFNPFFTTKGEGTGLGLTLVHRIVHNLGGELQVDNRLGFGAIFGIDLPVSTGHGGRKRK